MITVGSCFSGIGGIELGLESTGGFETRWQIELDVYARAVLQKHWPNVKSYGDIKTIKPEGLEPVGLICGGYPCQPFSLAGLRAGEADARNLWPYMLGLIRHIRPRYAILENVPGHLSLGFGRVLGDLAESGYDAEWGVLSAAGVGAPHLRRRVFIVAHSQRGGRNGRAGLLGQEGRAQPADGGEDVADAESDQQRRPWKTQRKQSFPFRGRGSQPSQILADAGRGDGQGPWDEERRGSVPSWWSAEPDVGGGSDGFPVWLDRHIGKGLSYAESQRRIKILRDVWNVDAAKAVRNALRGLRRMEAAEVLFTFVCEYEENGRIRRELMEGSEFFEEELRGVRIMLSLGSPPQEPEPERQPTGEHRDPVCEVSRFASSWEADVERVIHGIPKRVDRLKGLGNSVVPQVAAAVGRMILEQYAHQR